MKTSPADFTTTLLAAFACAFFTAATHGADIAKGSALPADLSKGLVLYYDFEKAPAGDKILDMSGRQNNGKATSVEWVADGHRGGAVKFAGPSSYITVPKSIWMNPKPLTLSCWIKIASGSPAPIFVDRVGQNNFRLGLFMGEPTLEIQGKRVNARVGFRWEEWHHIAGTYDGDEQRIYVDGLPRGEVLRWKSQAMPNTSDLTIGKHRAGPGLETILFHMDDIMMFSRALSADEIQALFKLQGGVRATGKVTAGSPIYAADQFVDPGSLKVKFLKEESAKLLPKGFKWIPGDSNNTPFAVMETDDPTDVVRAKPVYFDQKTGGEIHYSVQSEKPLTKLVYTGFAFREFFIEIHNEDGSLLASAGPYNLGNTEQTIEIPLPNITRFEVVLKTKSSAWVLIKRISFEPATSAPPKAAKPTPLAQPAPTAKATPTPTTTGTPTPADRIRKLKQQLEQGQINKDEYDRRVKEILDAI